MEGLSIEFPLALNPVVRSRGGGDPAGVPLPYHPAVWIVDRRGDRILDVAPDIAEVRRGGCDPNALVARASRIVAWLNALEERISAATGPEAPVPGLALRSFVSVPPRSSVHDAEIAFGVRLCGAGGEEFDRVARRVPLLAEEAALAPLLESLASDVARRYEEAASIQRSLQEAVESWRLAEEVAPSARSPMAIGDGGMEVR